MHSAIARDCKFMCLSNSISDIRKLFLNVVLFIPMSSKTRIRLGWRLVQLSSHIYLLTQLSLNRRHNR